MLQVVVLLGCDDRVCRCGALPFKSGIFASNCFSACTHALSDCCILATAVSCALVLLLLLLLLLLLVVLLLVLVLLLVVAEKFRVNPVVVLVGCDRGSSVGMVG